MVADVTCWRIGTRPSMPAARIVSAMAGRPYLGGTRRVSAQLAEIANLRNRSAV
jgi:hypothetical protein